MNYFKKNFYFAEIIFILILSLLPLIWFRTGERIYGSDSGYPLNYINYFIQRTYTWTPALGFGYEMSSYMGALPLHGIQYLLSIIQVPYLAVQKVTLVFWFATVAFAMYFSVKNFFNQKSQWVVRIIAVLIYSVNFHIFLFWQIGSQTTLSAYIFLPLAFLISYKFINKELSPLRAAVYLNLAYLFFNAGGVQGLPLLGSSIVVVIITLFYQAVIKINKNYILDVLKLVIFSLILFSLCNAYFLFPFLSSFSQQFNTLVSQNGGGVSGVLNWTRHVSKFSSFSNLFRLQGDNLWYLSNSTYPKLYLTNPFLILASFLFPLFSYLNLIFKYDEKVKKLLYLLVGISLLGIFLSAGSHDPLGFIYEFMIAHIPGFAAFRSAYYKFAPLVIFPFSILCGMSVYYLSNKVNKFKLVLPILFIIFIFGYNYPFFDNGNFLSNYKYPTMIKIPDHVKEFAKNVPSDDKYRTLVLPPLNSTNTIESYKWGYYGGYPIFPGISDKSYIENNSYLTEAEKTLVTRLYVFLRNSDYISFFNEAKRLSIKYILVTSDVVTNDRESPRENPKLYTSKLNQPEFKVIWKKKGWALYEISQAKIDPKIFAFRNLTFYKGPISTLPKIDSDDSNFIQSESDSINLPYSTFIESLSCTSCYSEYSDTLEAEPPRILPDSFIYPLKLYLENRKNPKLSGNEANYSNLGKSLKRLSELKGLSGIQEIKKDDNWIKAANLLLDNWMAIRESIEKTGMKTDLAVLDTVKNYSEFEMVNLKDVYNYESVEKNAKITSILRRIISQIDLTKIAVSKYLKSAKSINVAHYELVNKSEKGDVLFLQSSNGSNLPYEISFNNKELFRIYYPNSSGDVILPQPQGSYKNITLRFNQPTNLATRPYIKEIKPSYFKTESCLVYEVPNYAWFKSYNVSSEINGNTDGLYAYYIRGIGDPENKNEFKPNKVFDINKTNTRILDFSFSGRESDTTASVYFCGIVGSDLEKIYTNIRITSSSNPSVYVKKSIRGVNYNNVSISFTKINPSEYTITVKNAKSPFFIGFSEKYSDFWRLTQGSEKTQIMSHFTLNGYSNGWYIEKPGDNTYKLRYYQQNIFEKSVMVSIVSIMIMIGFLFAAQVKSKK